MKVFLTYVLILGVALLYTNAEAKPIPPMFTSITTRDGLSSNTVSSIVKDRYGLLWIATEDGLNKYNGSNFTIYRHNRNDPTSLESNDISTLYEDHAGRLWVGTIEGSLHLYDRKKDSFLRIRAGINVNTICDDQQGKLWVGAHTGLFTIDLKTLKVSKFSINGDSAFMDRPIRRLYQDRKKRMWVGTNDGLVVFQPQSNRIQTFAHQSENPESLTSNIITSITEDKRGNLWVATQNGLNQLLPNEKGFKAYRHEANDPASLSTNMIYAVAATHAEKLWICTEIGVNIMDLNTNKVERYLPDRNVPFSITNKSVKCVYVDPTEAVWLGTYQGGLNKYDKNLTLFGLQRSRPHDPASLSAPFVTSFAEKPNGDLFVGTDGGGLNVFHRKTNTFSHIKIAANSATATSNLAILSLAITPQDQLWIGTFQEGLFLLDVKTGKVQQFKVGSGSVNNNDIFCLKIDKSGKVWIGTNGGGLNCYDPVLKQFTYFNPPKSATPLLIPLNPYIRAIEEDHQGNLWIGSHGTGVAVYNPRTQKSIRYDKGNSNLPSNRIMAIHEDRNRLIWMGTNGEGLVRFNPKTQSFSVWGEDKGLPNGIVNRILEDSEGRIWVTTNKGISCLDQATNRFTNYTSHNGLQDDTFAYGSGIRTSDHTLFFGGTQGFNFLSPDSLKKSTVLPPILFTDLKVGNKTITAADSAITNAHISIAKEISLDYKQNFSISYAALNFSNAHQNTYRYRLIGYQEDWYYAGGTTVANYTNLNPGEYVFEVQASIDGNTWNTNGASITIVVNPPFYLTIYAFIFYLAAIGGSLWYFRHRSIQKIQQKFKQEQQKREDQRIHELDQMKIKFLTNLSHEFRTPISLILAPLETLFSRETDAHMAPQLQAIQRNAKRLLNLVNQLLDFKEIEQQEQNLNLSERDIVAFVRETSDSFHNLSEKKHIDFIFKNQVNGLNMNLDFDKIERVLFNLLSNAFKFTPKGGQISIEISTQSDEMNSAKTWLSIAVSDSGIGISPDKHARIFERFFQGNPQDHVINQGSGIGLSIAQEFVQMHEGQLLVESEPGQGSTFTVRLPVSTPIPEQIILEERTDSIKLTPPSDHPKQALRADGDFSADRILVVEDNEEMRHYLTERLKSYYQVFEAADGREGWQKALSVHPSLIISDVAMPHVDGIEFSQKVKSDKRTSHIPLVLLTASTGEQQQLRGLLSGANDYLTKPFNFEILNAKVNNLLYLNRLSKGFYSKQINLLSPEIIIESTDEKLLKDIILYVEEHLNSSQLSVENLSKHVGMSRGSLYSKLLELTGQTPIEFIRTVKLDRAAALLEKSDLNISQISYSVGFPNANYFTKSFKGKFNMLPSEYRNAKKGEALKSVEEKS